MAFENEWLNVLAKYSTIKEVFIICEETDPELCTNLQPLNEFRAALDHIMKLNASIYKNNDMNEALSQFEKLNSHLDRAFFDIADMACINYRNMICDMLERYDKDVIRDAIPNYYSELRPEIDEISNRIASYRNSKGNPETDSLSLFQAYRKDVFRLKDIHESIAKRSGSLEDLQSRFLKKEKTDKKSTSKTNIIAIIGIIVAVILGVIGWIV